MSPKTYVDSEGDEYEYSPHDYRPIRESVKGHLKDDPAVVSLLAILDHIERKSRPRLGRDVEQKDILASDAIRFATHLFAYVAGWAINHQHGLAEKGLSSVPRSLSEFKASTEYLKHRAAVDIHDHERRGAWCEPLDPVQERRFLFNFLVPIADIIGFPSVIEALEALEYGETLPIFERVRTTKRTGLMEYRAKLCAIAFIDYENEKGIKKRVSTETVVEAFSVTRDAVKDWKAELRIALGSFEVDKVLQEAKNAGQKYVIELKKYKDGFVGRNFSEDQYGKAALLRAAERYKARSKKM